MQGFDFLQRNDRRTQELSLKCRTTKYLDVATQTEILELNKQVATNAKGQNPRTDKLHLLWDAPEITDKPQSFDWKEQRKLSASSYGRPASVGISVSQNELPMLSHSRRSSTGSIKHPFNECCKLPKWYFGVLHGKEQTIFNLEDKINRLSVFEAESARKNQVIVELRADMAQLTQLAAESSISNVVRTQTEIILNLQDELASMEVFKTESQRKDILIIDLRKQISQLKTSHWDTHLVADTMTDTSHQTPEDEDLEAYEQTMNKKVKTLKARKTLDAQKRKQWYKHEGESEDTGDEVEQKGETTKDKKENKKQEAEHVKQGSEVGHQEKEEDLNETHDKLRDSMLLALGQFGQDVFKYDEDLLEYIEQLKEEMSVLQHQNEAQSHKLHDVLEQYNISTGAIASLNKEHSHIDNQLRSSKAEVERLSKELKERTNQLHAMTKKFSNLKEEKKHVQIIADLQKENFRLEQLVPELQQALAKKTELSVELKNEILGLQLRITDEGLRIKKFQAEHIDLLGKLSLLEHTEQQTQASFQHLQTKFDKIRTKVMQAVHISLGTTRIQSVISDKDILDSMQKIITDRVEFHQLLTDNGIPASPLFSADPGLSHSSLLSRD